MSRRRWRAVNSPKVTQLPGQTWDSKSGLGVHVHMHLNIYSIFHQTSQLHSPFPCLSQSSVVTLGFVFSLQGDRSSNLFKVIHLTPEFKPWPSDYRYHTLNYYRIKYRTQQTEGARSMTCTLCLSQGLACRK